MMQGRSRGWPWWPKPPQSPQQQQNIRQKQLILFTTDTLHIKLHSRASMEEKRLECLMMLQIHRSETSSIDGY